VIVVTKSFVNAVGGPEFAQLLASDVLSVLSHGATRPLVRKKAALCLLRLLRKSSDDSILLGEEWGAKIAVLLEESDLGVLLGLTSLLIGIISRSYEGYEACVPRLIEILERLRERDVPQDYTYYGIPSPWLQIKILRALQYFPAPENPAILKRLRVILREIITGNDPVKNPNKNNAVHAIVFEAAGVAVSVADEELMPLVVSLMVRFLTVRESNLRYLALENLSRLSQSYHIAKAIGKHRKSIIGCMSDPDPSITGGALNLLFTTANSETAAEIVEELLVAIEKADFSLREELVLKAAVLAERFPPSSDWYVDIMLRLILCAGDASSNEIWHSVVHLVSGKEDLHTHAVEKVISLLKVEVVNDMFLQCAAYILGEYGGNSTTPPMDQFMLLHQYYFSLPAPAKATVLNCYEKMRAREEKSSELAKSIEGILDSEAKSMNPEIQQRALEYKTLCNNPQIASIAMQTLPEWEVKKSVLLRKLVGKDASAEESRDRPSWLSSVDSINEEVITDSVPKVEIASQVLAEDVIIEEPKPVELMDLLSFGDESEQNTVTKDEENLQVFDNEAFEKEEEPTQRQEEGSEIEISSTEPIGDLAVWRTLLYASVSGVLYEDSNLQIGLRTCSESSNLEMEFYLGNKSAGALDIKKFSIPPTPYFEVTMNKAPASIESGQQILLKSCWTCLLPYSTLPVLQIQYVNSKGESMARSMTLPLPVTKFCKPVSVPSSVFVTRWNQVTGAPFKLKEHVHFSQSIEKRDLESLLKKLNCEILEVDIGTPSVNAVSIFHCTNGPVKQVPCMISLSASDQSMTNVQDLTISVATADAAVSASFMDALKSQASLI
jgi:AP-2 complex subunit alpha